MTIAVGQKALASDVLAALAARVAIAGGDITATVAKIAAGPSPILVSTIVADIHILRAYGYVGDGNSHPLSTQFASLAAAQAVYPIAQSLSDEFDGIALQTLINTSTVSALTIVMPRGSIARCSRALLSGTTALNIIGNWSSLVFLGGGNGITHVGTGAYCALQIDKLTITTGGVGNAAIACTLNPVTGYLTLTDVAIQGAGSETTNYWQNGVLGVNCSLTTMTRVALVGCNGGLISNSPNALKFTASSGADQYIFRDVTINYWHTALEFDGVSSPGMEGIIADNLQANVCMVGIKVANSQYPGYVPPQYNFDKCQWNIYQQWINIQGASEIWITDNLCYIHKPDSISGSVTALDFVLFTQCKNVEYRGNSVEGDALSTIANGIRFTTCDVGNVRSNKSHQYGAMTSGSAGLLIDADCTSIKEDGDNYFLVPSGSVPAINNGVLGAGCVSTTQVVTAGGTVDVAGNIVYQSNYVGTTATDGSLVVPLPAGLFKIVTSWLVSNGDTGTTVVNPGVRASSLVGVSSPTSFIAVFTGVASASVRIEFLLKGA